MPSLSRDELYTMVWADPMRTVAAGFAMSDVALRKYCVAANIPVPERGYWAKLAAGKPVKQAPLPPREPGAGEMIQIGGYSWNPDLEAQLAEPVPSRPHFAEPIDEVMQRVVGRRVRRLPFSRDLTVPHKGLRRILERDAKRAAKFAVHGWTWDQPKFAHGFERRRLLILNNLGLALAQHGAGMEVRGESAREINVTVGATRLRLAMDHLAAKPNRHGEWPTWEGSAADKMRIQVQANGAKDVLFEVADDETGKVEGKLATAAIEIVVAGEIAYRKRAEESYQRALEHREYLKAELDRRRREAERLAEERRLAEQKARRELLFQQAHDWRLAQDIRSFVRDVQARDSNAAKDPGFERWRLWALVEADALDPTQNGSFSVPEDPC